MRLSPEIIDRVRDAADIVAVVSDHVPLKRTGRTWKARCPFHQEKTPSFTVNPDRQIFKCFGCGEGGDVFQFLMEFEKLSFPEAVEMLANRAGIPLPRQGWAPADEQSVFPPLEWTAVQFQKQLAGVTGAPAREYLKRRGLNQETVEGYGLGWAAPGWENLLRAAAGKYPPALLERAGLVIANDHGGHYDRFRGRLMIPIRSALGRTVGFGARTLGSEEPKYLNSPETEVFNKRKVLFGLAEAREAFKARGEAVIVEGYMDVLALAQAGMQNVVASSGTAFTEDQARILRRYLDRSILIFDGDTAGLRAAWKSAGVFLDAGLEVKIVALPQGHDPDSFVRENGVKALEEKCQNAPGIVGFAQETLLGRLERREDLIKAFAYLGSRVDDPIRRRVFLQEAGERFRFAEEVLVSEAERLRAGKTRPRATTPEKVRKEPKDILGRRYLAGVMSGEGVSNGEALPETVFRESGLRALYGHWLLLRENAGDLARGRLLEDETYRGLATEILAVEEIEDDFEAVTERMRERLRASKREELKEAIREADSQGDRDQVDHLLRELHSLKEETKK